MAAMEVAGKIAFTVLLQGLGKEHGKSGESQGKCDAAADLQNAVVACGLLISQAADVVAPSRTKNPDGAKCYHYKKGSQIHRKQEDWSDFWAIIGLVLRGGARGTGRGWAQPLRG